MAAPAAVLQILVTANTAAATAALSRTDAQLKKTAATANTTSTAMGSRFAGAAKAAGTAVAGGLAYGLYKGVKAGIDFEKQMDAVSAVANANAKEMRQLEKQALKLGESTAYSANEVAVAQEELVKGGLRVKDVVGGALPAALSLAAAGQLDLGVAAETTVNAMKLFGLAGKDARQVADMLATAANKTTADVEDFAMALRQGGAVTKQAGYDMNQTVTVLEALAEAGIKNSDAGTSMKAAFIQLLKPTEQQAALARQLGIDFVNQSGAMKSAAAISRELIAATSDMTQAERTKTFAVLAGTDGFRTLSALYDAGPAKLDKLTRANARQGTAQEIAREKMDNTAGSLEQLSGAFETLSIKMFRSAQSPFRGFIDGLTDSVQEFTAIVTSKKLTSDEKISAVLSMISDGIRNAIPKIADAAFRLGLAITKGIARAFWEGDLLTKLFIGAGLVKLFGGASALRAAGMAVGKPLGRGVALGIVSAVALTALIAPEVYKLTHKLGEIMRKPMRRFFKWVVDTFGGVADKVMGVFTTIIGGIADVMDRLGDVPIIGKPFQEAADALHDVEDGVNGVRDAMREIRKFRDDPLGFTRKMLREHAGDIGATTNALVAMGIGYKRATELATKASDGLSPTLRRNDKLLDTLGGTLGTTTDKTKRYGKGTDDALDGVRKQFNRTAGIVNSFTRDSGRDLDRSGDDTGRFKDKADKNLDRVGDAFGKTTDRSGKMARGVGHNITSLANGVATGLEVLKDNLNKSLAAFKVKKVGYSVKKVGNTVGNVIGAQKGAIVPGSGSGDKVPLHIDGRLSAMVEPGEMVSVANRTATAALMRVNRDIPRRQDGGIVPHLAKGGGLMAPFDVQGSKPGFVPFMNFLNNMYGPLYVMSGYRPGSITTSGNVSNHASGHAVDISTHESGVDQATGPGSLGGPGAARMDDLHSYMARNIKLPGDFLWRTYTGGNHYNHIHRGITSAEADDPRKMIAYLSGLPGGGAIAESLKRLILKGPKGPLREMGQGALDKAWKAANDFLSRQGPGYSAGKYLKGKGDIFTASWYGPTPATVGAAGVSLPGTMSFAELSDPPGSLNFSALGGLPYHAKIGVRYKGKAIEVEKLDVGAGGPGLGGHVRAIDLWEDAAKQLPGFMSAGIANVEVLRKHGGLVPRLAKGGILDFGSILDATRSHDNDPDKRAKATKKAVEKFSDAIKGFGLPEKLVKTLTDLRHDADVFGEYAGNASSLSDEGVFGKFRGLTEAEWTEKQLAVLFKLRNRLVAAKKIIEKRIKQQVKLLKEAEKRLRDTNKAIKLGDRERDDLEDRLEKAKKAKNKDLIAHLEDRLDSLDERQDLRKAVAAKLKAPIIPSLRTLGSTLKTGGKEMASRSSIGEALESVQGIDGPMRKMRKLPALGMLGGEIFDAQLRLRDLGIEANPIDTGISIDELRSVIEAARFGAFDDQMRFHTGGIVPGSGDVPIVAQGGEGVFTRQQMAAMGKGTTQVHVENHFDWQGMDLYVETKVDGQIAKREKVARRRGRQVAR